MQQTFFWDKWYQKYCFSFQISAYSKYLWIGIIEESAFLQFFRHFKVQRTVEIFTLFRYIFKNLPFSWIQFYQEHCKTIETNFQYCNEKLPNFSEIQHVVEKLDSSSVRYFQVFQVRMTTLLIFLGA